MAELFRPRYYVDANTGKRCKKSHPGATRCRSKTWWFRFYTPDGRRPKFKGYRDKKATETLAAETERRAIRIDAGLVDPTEEHAKRPLAEHAEDFYRFLIAKGDTVAYVGLVRFRLTAILDSCRFVRSADVQASAVLSFLADLRAKGKSLKTANEYLAAVKGFTRWLWRDRRTPVDPLAGMSRIASKGEVDVRHARRDFEPDELRRLLEAARQCGKLLSMKERP